MNGDSFATFDTAIAMFKHDLNTMVQLENNFHV